MTTRREFVRSSLVASAAALARGRDDIGTLPWWWTAPRRDPATSLADLPDRLPIQWYRDTIARLQRALQGAGLDGLLCKDQWNIVYLSGYFHSTTERPEALWVPAVGEPTLFCPGLDRDLVTSWWIRDAEFYFDYPQADGDGDPRTGTVATPQGTTDLWLWMLNGLERRGFGAKSIGLDWDAPESTLAKFRDTLKSATFRHAGDIPMQLRVIKTPEEIALTQRAIDYHDRILEFCRQYVLEHGTDATDFAVRHAAEAYGTELVMPDIRRDGRPHTAVGVSINVGCRTGVGTAYPHPNQFFHSKIQRGDAIQFSGVMVRIGGYGGEGYRACHLAPMTDAQRRMWEVHTEMTLAQQEFSKAGVECRAVATRVLEIARRAALERFVYHRPAHGAGMEGHQKPYISLGDTTVLAEGMMFSNEPGLYDPQGGYGYNHSNNLLITKARGEQMNRTPLTKAWCWLKL
ncbi:MAG: aminopeptidase P family protein [Gemmatimonadetes bacterium]|nr:aminopeptidase P family protein [Gemmatimonadota bacterium]